LRTACSVCACVWLRNLCSIYITFVCFCQISGRGIKGWISPPLWQGNRTSKKPHNEVLSETDKGVMKGAEPPSGKSAGPALPGRGDFLRRLACHPGAKIHSSRICRPGVPKVRQANPPKGWYWRGKDFPAKAYAPA
jgi:hypothetical protein